jgi:hypothetical protein
MSGVTLGRENRDKRRGKRMTTTEDRIRELETQLGDLQAEVRALRETAMLVPSPVAHNASSPGGRISRRGALFTAGAAAAGVAAALANSTTPALAANGDPVTVAGTFSGAGTTTINGSVLTDPALVVTNYNGGSVDHYSDALQAYTFGAGFAAIYGRNDAAGGSAIIGYSAGGLAATLNGASAPLLLVPGTSAGAPSSGAHSQGEVYVGNTGTFWICVAAGSPGTWKQLATTDLGIQSFPNPRRVFGSGSVPFNSTQGPIDGTTQTNLQSSGVPAGARSAYCAVQSYDTGRLTLFPDLTADPGIANWGVSGNSGELKIEYMLVPLSPAGKFKFHSYVIGSGSVYIDAWGFLM